MTGQPKVQTLNFYFIYAALAYARETKFPQLSDHKFWSYIARNYLPDSDSRFVTLTTEDKFSYPWIKEVVDFLIEQLGWDLDDKGLRGITLKC